MKKLLNLKKRFQNGGLILSFGDGGDFQSAFDQARANKQMYFAYNGKVYNSQKKGNDYEWDMFTNNLADAEATAGGTANAGLGGWENEASEKNKLNYRGKQKAYQNEHNYVPNPSSYTNKRNNTRGLATSDGIKRSGTEYSPTYRAGDDPNNLIARPAASYYDDNNAIPNDPSAKPQSAGRAGMNGWDKVTNGKNFNYNTWWANTGLTLDGIKSTSYTRNNYVMPIPTNKLKMQKEITMYNRNNLRNIYAQAYAKKLKEAGANKAYNEFFTKDGKWKSNAMFERNFNRWLSSVGLTEKGDHYQKFRYVK